MKKTSAFRLLFVSFLFLSITSYSQNGTRLTGFDAVTAGRAGVATGTFDNPSLMMNNPAGLSFLKKSQLDINFILLNPVGHFENAVNPETKGKPEYFPMGSIGYVKATSKKLTYGIGLYTYGGAGGDYDLNHDLYVKNGSYVPQPYHSRFAVLQGGLSLAYKITPKFSVGVSAHLLYSSIAFQMPLSMPPSMLKGVSNYPTVGSTFGNMFSNVLGYQELVASANMKSLSAIQFNGKIGLAYKPNNKISFGLNYTLPVNLNYKNGTTSLDMNYQMTNAFGEVVAGIMAANPSYTAAQAQAAAQARFTALGINLALPNTDSYSTTAKVGLPQSLAVGMSVKANKKLNLGLDLEWINWSKAFNEMDIALTGGTNANFIKMVGSNSINMPFPMNWKDAVMIRVGGEYAACKKLTLRCGYAYGTNPVPPSTVFPVFCAIMQNQVSIGGSYSLSNNVKLNAAYQYAFRNNETATNPSLVGEQFSGSTSSVSVNTFQLSVSWFLK